MANRKLSVVANPYCALDADGKPCGVVTREDNTDLCIGAQLDVEATAKARGKRQYTFSSEAVEVPMTAYYLRRLHDRELLPADAETARIAGIKEFELPSQAIARFRKDAGDVQPIMTDQVSGSKP